MYTKLDDINHAKKINAYIQSNPAITRGKIYKNCVTNIHRVNYLALQGLIILPKPTPRHIRNREWRERRS